MLALTLWQPWATAIAHHGKLVENRTWAPPTSLVSKRFAIHAGKRFDREAYEMLAEMGAVFSPSASSTLRRVFTPRAELPLGAIVATARVAGWVRSEWIVSAAQHPFDFFGVTEEQARSALRSTWWIGPVGWVLDHVIAFEPVPCCGAQGLWSLPADVERLVRERETNEVRRAG